MLFGYGAAPALTPTSPRASLARNLIELGDAVIAVKRPNGRIKLNQFIRQPSGLRLAFGASSLTRVTLSDRPANAGATRPSG
jgi:hypothetical protein